MSSFFSSTLTVSVLLNNVLSMKLELLELILISLAVLELSTLRCAMISLTLESLVAMVVFFEGDLTFCVWGWRNFVLCWEFFFYFYMWRSRNPWAFFRCRSESVASILCFLLIYRSYVCKCEIEQTLSLSTMTSFNVSECSKLWDRKSYISLMSKLFLLSCLVIFPSVSDGLKYKPFPGPFFFYCEIRVLYDIIRYLF